MKKDFLKNLMVIVFLSGTLMACDKSSFKIRGSKGDGNTTAGQLTPPPTTPGTPNNPGNPNNPGTPGNPTHPGYPTNPGQPQQERLCQYQYEVLGSFSYIVYGADSLQLFWNPYHASGSYHVAYYYVVVKDKQGNMFTSQRIPEKPAGDPNYHTLFLEPWIIGDNGRPMAESFTLQHGGSYWYDIIAYDSYDQPVNPNPRYIDISQTGYPRQHVEAGFCHDYQFIDFPRL